MKTMLEEYGTYIISAVIGMGVIGIGAAMYTMIGPMVQSYVQSLM